MLYDLNLLSKYIEEGWIVKQDHPTLPLSIYNYSRACQYEKKWDDVTLNCRGLILDQQGNVIAKGFSKFFNYEEVYDQVPLQQEHVWVQDKMDGSLGILFYYEDEWHMATRGSFTSEQAVKGLEIAKATFDLNKLVRAVNYLCEIIYPENRIVVDYGSKEKIVFLSTVFQREELAWTTTQALLHSADIPLTHIVPSRLIDNPSKEDYEYLKKLDSKNEEGFVLRFHPSNFRMKIKFAEYVRLHSLLTNFATTDIWEALKEGRSEDILKLLDQVPDEFDKWVRYKIAELKYAYYSIYERCGKAHDHFRYGKYNDVDPEPSKKDYALYVQKNIQPQLHPVMYAMWNGEVEKQNQLIWKLLKPDYQKPFWSNEKLS